MAIDLCVVAYNNCRELPRLLDHLNDGKYQAALGNHINWTLSIADNDSTDGTREALKDIPWLETGVTPMVLYNENIGYARACNQLAAIGDSEIIGFLNADVWLSSYDVMQIQDAFDSDRTISILGPKQRDERGYITHAGIEGTNTDAQPRAWRMKDPRDKFYRGRERMVSVAGSAYFIRRPVWDFLTECQTYQKMYPGAIGAMLETELYYEETYLSYHARAHGFQVVYDGSISIGHSWHASSPVGSQVHKFHDSRKIFRKACAMHDIECD